MAEGTQVEKRVYADLFIIPYESVMKLFHHSQHNEASYHFLDGLKASSTTLRKKLSASHERWGALTRPQPGSKAELNKDSGLRQALPAARLCSTRTGMRDGAPRRSGRARGPALPWKRQQTAPTPVLIPEESRQPAALRALVPRWSVALPLDVATPVLAAHPISCPSRHPSSSLSPLSRAARTLREAAGALLKPRRATSPHPAVKVGQVAPAKPALAAPGACPFPGVTLARPRRCHDWLPLPRLPRREESAAEPDAQAEGGAGAEQPLPAEPGGAHAERVGEGLQRELPRRVPLPLRHGPL
nr:PREDICTED: uncharacterized protein LOC106485294 [Apteryx mantelli mantelli]